MDKLLLSSVEVKRDRLSHPPFKLYTYIEIMVDTRRCNELERILEQGFSSDKITTYSCGRTGPRVHQNILWQWVYEFPTFTPDKFVEFLKKHCTWT